MDFFNELFGEIKNVNVKTLTRDQLQSIVDNPGKWVDEDYYLQAYTEAQKRGITPKIN